MKIRHVLLPVATAMSVSLVACGGEDKSSANEQSTPAQAVMEIGTVETALETALRQVEAGDRPAAEETVAQAYVDHFEKVEGPLGKADGELNEKLEEAISDELRQKIESGAPAAEVQTLVAKIKADLATAKRKLGG